MNHSNLIDITQPPYLADPTGSRDCTDIILQALDDITERTRLELLSTWEEMEALPDKGSHFHPHSFENRRVDGDIHISLLSRLPYLPVLYFPEGTYLVSETLCYRHKDLINTYDCDLNMQIRMRGAGKEKTVLRLVDNAPGYEGATRKPVVSFMPGHKSNVAMSNYFEDMGINCGSGNPGAIGLDFFANNSGAVRSVRIMSEDRAGYAGLMLGHSIFSGVLLANIEIKGFDHGLHVHSEEASFFAHAEQMLLEEQNVSAVTVGAISLSLRKIKTRSVPIAVKIIDPRSHVAIVDSELRGDGPMVFDRKDGYLYASNVDSSGFADARRIDDLVEPIFDGCFLDERVMARLPIESAPMWERAGNSTGVRNFGAIGNGVNDDSAAIQRAMNVGSDEVIFEPGTYLINQPVMIPAHVEHIDFSFCNLVAGPDLAKSEKEGFVIGGDDGAAPIFIERLLAWERWAGRHCTFTHASKRTVCFKDMHTQTLRFYQNTVRGGKVFLDNVATTTGVNSHGSEEEFCNAIFKGQRVWGRQFNPERGGRMIVNDGGDVVILGFKSEGPGIVAHTLNGGRTELLGGHLNIGRKGELAFLCENSQMRVSISNQNRNSHGFYETMILDRNKKEEKKIRSEDLPLRGPCQPGVFQCVLPIYASPRI